MDVFALHRQMLGDYAAYTRSFIRIADDRISKHVDDGIRNGLLWPDPLLQLNPSFEPGAKIDQLVDEGLLHTDCGKIFRIKSDANDLGKPLRLHWHQEQAIRVAARNEPYVLTTGTGSGKSLSYIIPAVDHVLKTGTGQGIKAIVVYPMNALANSQREELDKFLNRGFDGQASLVTFARYTGQENEDERERILSSPPDILLTNYVMLELILTRIRESRLVEHSGKLRFLVFDELHTYRGRQGADVALLIRRCREAFKSAVMRCVGTSATMASAGSTSDQAIVVGGVASKIFGEDVRPENVIGERLRRTTPELAFTTATAQTSLRTSINASSDLPVDYHQFCQLPLASWLEQTFGLRREPGSQKLVRQTPQPLRGPSGAAELLAQLVNLDASVCESAIQQMLYAGSRCINPDSGFPVFAFRLHQFISRGDTVWASVEEEDSGLHHGNVSDRQAEGYRPHRNQRLARQRHSTWQLCHQRHHTGHIRRNANSHQHRDALPNSPLATARPSNRHKWQFHPHGSVGQVGLASPYPSTSLMQDVDIPMCRYSANSQED